MSSAVAGRAVRPVGQLDRHGSSTRAAFGFHGTRERPQRLERVPDVVERLPRQERHAVLLADLHECILREHDVRVQGAVPVRLALADERDRSVPLPEPLRGKHLAGAAPDALGVTVRVAQRPPALGLHELVRHDLEVPEARAFQDRPDVEREPVGREHERRLPLFRPRDERRERRRELGVFEREREHLLARALQHRDLVVRRLAQAHLAGVDRVVEPLPARLAEPVQQQLGHVLQAGCAVEVHEERFHREHRWSVPAPSSL